MSTRLNFVRVAALGLGVALSTFASFAAPSSEATRPSAQAAASKSDQIEHQVPRRDYVGKQPRKFAWTAAPDADHYAIGIWNEVDRLIWRKDDITGTSVEPPAELDLEEGTYYWTVSGLRGTQEVAKSGLAAFVVEK